MRTLIRSRRHLMVAMLSFVIVISFSSRTARSFSSFFTAGDWHQRITATALSQIAPSCQFSGEAVTLVIRTDRDQDWREMSIDSTDLIHPLPNTSDPSCGTVSPCPYRPEHHFDRFETVTRDPAAVQTAFVAGVTYLSAKRSRIGSMVGQSNTEAALIALGRALHAVQDVFSHSNYVDLGLLDQEVLVANVADGILIGPPSSLLITRYDYRDPANAESPTDGDPPRVQGDPRFPYTHKAEALDFPGKNARATAVAFAGARDAAVKASVEFIQSILNDTPGFCSQASAYPNSSQQNNSDPSDPDEPGKYPSSGSNDPPPTSIFQGSAAGPIDPNEKSGSVGIGQLQYISGQTPLRYAVYFANKAIASAPAQNVLITDQLDLTNDDLSSFRLGPIQFLGNVVNPPSGFTGFVGTVDLRPANGLLVAVSAKLDTSSGLLTWAFRSLDPSTGQPPSDPTVGFLPPGGEGSVFFTVKPKQGLATNTQINNQATIIFDVNSPISTAVWLNTLDNTPPTSHVVALQPIENLLNFPIQWTGSDVGAGVQDYTIYVSDNGSAFTVFRTNATGTSATFSGLAGHKYAFYSIARDLVGNTEAAKSVADATTEIGQSFAALTAEAEITTHSRPRFELRGTFTPGSGGGNVAPDVQPVSLVLGNFSTAIPAGSFRKHRSGIYTFESKINDVHLEFRIAPMGGGSFRFNVEGEGATSLAGTTNPVTVELLIGGNGGTAQITAEINERHREHKELRSDGDDHDRSDNR